MTTFIMLIGIFVATVLLIRMDCFYEYATASLATLIHLGSEAVCSGFFVKSDNYNQADPEWFHQRTVILGYNNRNERGPATALFSFPLPKGIASHGGRMSAFLLIETDRLHAGLHSQLGPKIKKAIIEINGQNIDEFWLIDKMPNGQDYGFKNVGPIPIENRFLTKPILEVMLKIEDQMAWDIDRVIVQINYGSPRLTVHGSMIVGALISAGIGLLPSVVDGIIAIARTLR